MVVVVCLLVETVISMFVFGSTSYATDGALYVLHYYCTSFVLLSCLLSFSDTRLMMWSTPQFPVIYLAKVETSEHSMFLKRGEPTRRLRADSKVLKEGAYWRIRKISWAQRITNVEIAKRTNINNIVGELKGRKWICMGYVLRMSRP